MSSMEDAVAPFSKGLECVKAVESELVKVNKKIRDASFNCNSIDRTIKLLENAKAALDSSSDMGNEGELPEDVVDTVHQGIIQAQSDCSKFSRSHKEIHSSLSKFGKSIDKNFTSDYGPIMHDEMSKPDTPAQVNTAIVQHLLRHGHQDIAEQLTQESQLVISDEQKQPFLELNRILVAMRERDLVPAFEWVEARRHLMEDEGELKVELALHRLRYIQLLSQGLQSEALAYARNICPEAKSQGYTEIQRLMTALLYVKTGLENSPYADLLDPREWQQGALLFAREYCSLLKLPVESPLAVSVAAGCVAMSPLLSIKQVLKQTDCSGVWRAEDELPVEIDLGPACQFHSVFACPILRQRSTANNPPMRLTCGHVISRDAVNRLQSANKLKCPYCPQDMSVSNLRHIHF